MSEANLDAVLDVGGGLAAAPPCRFRSDIAVTPVPELTCGTDRMTSRAAWVVRPDEVRPGEGEAAYRRLIRSCVSGRHTSPVEKGLMTVYVEAPLSCWVQWTRHRFMGSGDFEDFGFCLAGDTLITCGRTAKSGRPELTKVPISQLYEDRHLGRKWAIDEGEHVGVHRSSNGKRWVAHGRRLGESGGSFLGTFDTKDEAIAARQAACASREGVRRRRLAFDASRTLRVLNEDTGIFEFAPMVDVVKSGVQELVRVETVDGHSIRATKKHRFLTVDGWKMAGELVAGDAVAVVGRRPTGERAIPLRLRQGIGLWSTAQRSELIREVDFCHVCGDRHTREDLILDHVIPVVTDLSRALDRSNLRPICRRCNAVKSGSESRLKRSPMMRAGRRFSRLSGKPTRCGEEMTYDIEMPAPWHNFVANEFVVHNSISSGRYRVLDGVFYVPPAERPCFEPAGFKPMRPALVSAAAYAADKDPIGPHLTADDDGYSLAQRQMRVAALESLVSDCTRRSCSQAYREFRTMVDAGVAREVARNVLGPAAYFNGYVEAKPATWLHFFSLRTADARSRVATHPQWEIEQISLQCERLFAEQWPLAYAAFNEAGRAL